MARQRIVLNKKYYVGSDSMVEGGLSHHFLRKTVEECVVEASRRLDENKHMTEIYIVEVVAVVKRASTPVVVQEVV